jgi:hypothetical protein
MRTLTAYNGIKLVFNEEKHQLLVNGEICPDNVTSATSRLDKSGALTWWAAEQAVGKLGWFNEKKFKEKGATESEIKKLWATAEAAFTKIQKMGFEDFWNLLTDARKAHQERKEAEATLGGIVHEFAERFALGLKPELPEDERARNGALAFLKWLDEEKLKLSKLEEIIYSKKNHYWGVKDADGARKGKLFCLDYKTSSGIYPEMRAQAAAYLFGNTEMRKRDYDGYIINHFDKETGQFSFLLVEKKEAKKDFEFFLNLLAVKRRESEIKNGNINVNKK